MSFGKKITLFCIVFIGISIGLFLLCEDWFAANFTQDTMQSWAQNARPWAWLVAIGLLVADLLLPIPATPIMAALGAVYGPLGGGLLAALGSTLSAISGYGIARWAEGPLLQRVADQDEIRRFQHFYDTWGGAAIILSRSLPVLPEIMSILAGLAKMHFGRFVFAVLIGAIPTGIFMAWVGYASRESTATALVAVTALPVLLWPVYLVIAKRFAPAATTEADNA